MGPTSPPPQSGPGVGGHGSHPRATIILVLGILSIVCCGLFTGVPAIIMGRTALADIDSQPGAYSNRGTVFAGYICGMVGTVLSALGLLLTLLLAF